LVAGDIRAEGGLCQAVTGVPSFRLPCCKIEKDYQIF
jgi:hypothetical protein